MGKDNSVLADHVKSERKRISDNILKSYKNIEDVTTPTISVEKFNEDFFEKSEQFSVISDAIMKSFVHDLIETVNETERQEAKVELLEKAKIEIQAYKKFNVQPKEGDSIVFYVKDKIEKGEDEKSIGKTSSGKDVYDGGINHPKHKDFTAKDHSDAARLHQDKLDGKYGHNKNWLKISGYEKEHRSKSIEMDNKRASELNAEDKKNGVKYKTDDSNKMTKKMAKEKAYLHGGNRKRYEEG